MNGWYIITYYPIQHVFYRILIGNIITDMTINLSARIMNTSYMWQISLSDILLEEVKFSSRQTGQVLEVRGVSGAEFSPPHPQAPLYIFYKKITLISSAGALNRFPFNFIRTLPHSIMPIERLRSPSLQFSC